MESADATLRRYNYDPGLTQGHSKMSATGSLFGWMHLVGYGICCMSYGEMTG